MEGPRRAPSCKRTHTGAARKHIEREVQGRGGRGVVQRSRRGSTQLACATQVLRLLMSAHPQGHIAELGHASQTRKTHTNPPTQR